MKGEEIERKLLGLNTNGMEWNGESGIGVRLSGRIQQHVRCAEGGGRWAVGRAVMTNTSTPRAHFNMG